MDKRMGRILVGIISTALLIGVCEAGPVPSDSSGETTDREAKLLTDVHASIEIAGVSGGDYRLKTARQLQFDILKVKEWFFRFGIQENSLFDYSPSQFDHTIQYFATGYETSDGRISLFWDHTCNNPARKLLEEERNDIRWNEIGIGYETTGMRFGHNNDDIDFDYASEWLNILNWRISLSKVWMRTENDYEYMFKLGIRDDVLRVGNQVFYAQFNFNAIYDDRGTNLDPLVEAGDRILLGKNVCLVPFVSYERFNDWYGLDEGEDFFLAGLRLEAALGGDNSPDLESSRKAKNTGVFPGEQSLRFHVNGGYNANLQGTKKKTRSSDLNVDLDLLKFDDDKVFTINTYAGILTESGAFEIQNVNYKIGPSLKINLADYYLRLFHSYSCLYGVDDEGVIRNYNLLGAEMARDAQLSWHLLGAVYPSTTNFDYHAHLQATLGYDFRAKGITPYMNGSLNYLFGDNSVFGNAFEGGLKIPGKEGAFIVYLRLEDSFDVFRFGEGSQTWLGFRLVF
jgi:hypothetical protein